MTSDDGPYVELDFVGLCKVFRTWYDMEGLSHSRIVADKGPAGPTITKLYNGTWRSKRPSEVTDKIDKGLGWQRGTAWSILTRRPGSPRPDWGKDELLAWSEGRPVESNDGGSVDLNTTATISTTGEVVKGDTKDALHEIREIRDELRALSARVERLEQAAHVVDVITPEVAPAPDDKPSRARPQ